MATTPQHSPRMFQPAPDSPPRMNAAAQVRNGNFAAALQLLLAAGEPTDSGLMQKMKVILEIQVVEELEGLAKSPDTDVDCLSLSTAH